MGQHSDLVHVWEPHEHFLTWRPTGEVEVVVKRCGCGAQWFIAGDEQWQEDEQGVTRPAHPLWSAMEAERDLTRNETERWEAIRATQAAARHAARVARAEIDAALSADPPALARAGLRQGRRDPAELGVWDDRWWHYEVSGSEVLVFYLDPKRRGAPVWRFPASDVPYAPTA